MKDLKGKKIGLSKSLNTIKNDWWRITEHMGIESMLRLNDMTMDDVQIVEFPYPDDWYGDPRMLEPMINPTDLWATRDHKHDLAFRPLETALLKRQGGRDLHPEQAVSSTSRRRRGRSRRSRTSPGTRTGPCRSPTRPPSSPAPT